MIEFKEYIKNKGFIFKSVLFLKHPDITAPSLYFTKNNITIYFREKDNVINIYVDNKDILNKDVYYKGLCDTITKFETICKLLNIQ